MRDEFAMESARNGPLFLPGEDLFRTRFYIQHPALTGGTNAAAELKKNSAFYAQRWWDDGTVLAGGREFTGLLASGCYTRGTMSCLSCHSMHDSNPNDQLSARGKTSAACTQCHRDPRFTTEVSRHTFHAVGSSGSDCLNCHMPYTTYALFKGIRSHQITSPRADTSARFGTPNACNLCHLDRTLDWTGEWLTRWYRQPATVLPAQQTNTAASLLWLLKGHAAQRVIAAWSFGWEPAQRVSGTNWMAPSLAQLLGDSYGPVRYVAHRSLRTLPGFEGFRFDFLASIADRVAARDRAVGLWSASAKTSTTNPIVLLKDAGQFDEGRAHELLRDQDARSVTIQE
jgi:predicted CXXCH cytochrome family protein